MPGVVFCGFVGFWVPVPWSGELDGDVLFGVVLCAATQIAESSSTKNSEVLILMTVSRLRSKGRTGAVVS